MTPSASWFLTNESVIDHRCSNNALPWPVCELKVRTVLRTAAKMGLGTHVSENLESAWGCVRHCFNLNETGGIPGGTIAMCRTCIVTRGSPWEDLSQRCSAWDGITGEPEETWLA